MPRQPRMLADGAYYHVLTRGNDKRVLFSTERDHQFFLGVIGSYLAKFRVQMIHYCLMPTHLHFLLRLDAAADLPKFMQGVLQVYAEYFRRRYESYGFVFQNRYKSLLIENESYLLECARYIERNPVRARLVTDPGDYPWSSYNYYANGIMDDIVILANPAYLGMASEGVERKKCYKKYVCAQRPYDIVVDKAFKI